MDLIPTIASPEIFLFMKNLGICIQDLMLQLKCFFFDGLGLMATASIIL